MDWTLVYQVTVFLAIALLAVVVTIFVLASSLLGLAVESASEEEKRRRAEQDSRIGEQVEQARTELEQAATGTGEFEQAEKTLKELRNEKKEFEKATKRILQGYEVFRAKGGVLYPCIPILVSLVLSALAWGLGMGTYQSISLFLWGFGVAAIAYSLYRVYFALTRIERVAVTSERAALTRMTTALGTALEEHEEVKKPRLRFEFRDKNPPFHGQKDSTLKVSFNVSLEQGQIARDVGVYFFAPQSFSFPGYTTWLQQKGHKIPSARTCCVACQTVFFDTSRGAELETGTPAKKGTFTLGYQVICEGFTGEIQEFQVVLR